MTTQQNIKRADDASAYDIAQLLAGAIAGQRSPMRNFSEWSGREGEALYRAAEELLPLYQNGQLPDAMVARLGRSMSLFTTGRP